MHKHRTSKNPTAKGHPSFLICASWGSFVLQDASHADASAQVKAHGERFGVNIDYFSVYLRIFFQKIGFWRVPERLEHTRRPRKIRGTTYEGPRTVPEKINFFKKFAVISDKFANFSQNIMRNRVPPLQNSKNPHAKWAAKPPFLVPFFRVLGGGIPVSHNIFRGICKIIANYRSRH